ncbi:uroporphyrinogen-III synthase [Pseudaminobacter sp. NGMCC 1.201702]|uniref:uroporphyrinogen-III synthase n=1 Tax=Pseudaminobacter sp. NGMCC 1.201702 TaxID=3391825 RepID=UPI0039F0FF53
MAGARVLVTRPEPGASKTARRLEEAGFSPVILPLSRTVPLPVGIFPTGQIDAVAATSVNALRHAPADLIASLACHRCFAVGAKTAAVAREMGFAAIVEGHGDAASLADMLLGEPDIANVVYLAGRVRRDGFEDRLAGGGIKISVIETYDTRPVKYMPDELDAALDGGTIDAVLLYSAKAAEGFSNLLADPLRHSLFESARYFCLSPRIAAALSGGSRSRIFTASKPTEDDLLARLIEVL